MTLAVIASTCGGSSSSPSTTPSAAANRPIGGPVPAQLIGDWSMEPQAVTNILEGGGNPGCPKPLMASTCMVQFKLTAAKYSWVTNLGLDPRAGDVVVNHSEMDFFNGPACGLQLPQGVGRYTWSLTGTVLQFAPLNQDPCPRSAWLAGQTYSRAS